MFRRGPRTPAPTPRKPSTRYSHPSTPTSRGPPNRPSPSQRGFFTSLTWHCDCTPRLPAEHFRVKKEGKNHGRWFYTCQNSEGKRCGFFLWDDDAKVREEKTVLAGKTTEPGREGEGEEGKLGRGEVGRFEVWEREQEMERRKGEVRQGKGEVEGDAEANPEWKKAREANGEGDKRKREVLEVDDDTTEDELDDVMSWPPTARGEVETPSKRQKVEEVMPVATTKRKLPWLNYEEEEVRTPSKNTWNGLPTPSLTETNGQDPSTSPTTGRFRDAMRSPPAEGASSVAGQTLGSEVFDLLEKNGVSLGEKAQADLRAALTRHEMKLQGVIKGRDLVRTALKGKEARIAELQGRIAGIEAEREVLRGALSRLKGPDV